VLLVIRGNPENKNGLTLGKGFKNVGSDARIIHDTNLFAIVHPAFRRAIALGFIGFAIALMLCGESRDRPQHQGALQSTICNPGTNSKSRRFRVTTVAPTESAIAAILTSR
jgi:hypothetical protein